jgi:zinc transport system substrate-binding protein
VLLLAGCGDSGRREAATSDSEAVREGPLSVFVVNHPLRFMAESIGGEHVRVSFPAPAEVDPATWIPDGDTLAAYQSADLILLNGAGYARWVGLASLPRAHVVDTSAAFGDRLIALEGSVTHTHGPAGAHAHEGTAFTTWLDPTLAIEQARAIAQALTRARPQGAESFSRNLAQLEANLRELDARLTAAARRIGDAPLLFSHPVYQYLIRRYGLNARSVHWEPGEPPDDAMFAELDALLDAHEARWMIWEGAPLPATGRALRARGVDSLVFEPGANTPAEGDFLTLMEDNARALEGAFASNDEGVDE